MLANAVAELVPSSWAERRRVLLFAVAVQALLSVGLVVSALVVAGTANAGPNAVLTALMTVGYVAGAFQVVSKSSSPIAIGYLMGISGALSALSLMTAVYWGQLSHCMQLWFKMAQYTCSNPSAYASMSAFSSMFFILQLFVTYGVYSWRTELIDETGLYDEISDASNAYLHNQSFDAVLNNSQSHTVGQRDAYGKIPDLHSSELEL